MRLIKSDYPNTSSLLSVHCGIVCIFGVGRLLFAIFTMTWQFINWSSSWSKFRQALVESLQKRVHICFCHPYRRGCSEVRTAVVFGMRTPASENVPIDLFGTPRRNHPKWERKWYLLFTRTEQQETKQRQRKHLDLLTSQENNLQVSSCTPVKTLTSFSWRHYVRH